VQQTKQGQPMMQAPTTQVQNLWDLMIEALMRLVLKRAEDQMMQVPTTVHAQMMQVVQNLVEQMRSVQTKVEPN
jgi:hypothetical protein